MFSSIYGINIFTNVIDEIRGILTYTSLNNA